MKVPFNDLQLHHHHIKKQLHDVIEDVIGSSAFIRGPYVEKFEDAFAKKFGVKHCISCANGTDALYISMKALDLKKGDEVIVPAHSWISSSETITQAGGVPIFCDTKLNDYTLDINLIESLITKNTVGIIPVHLFGHSAEMDSIHEIAKKNKLWILEDCAQAHLAKYKNKLVGTLGDVSTFSFYPGKNLGAMGDAGAILTNDNLLAEKMRKFARHGGLKKGIHDIEGINSRMDGLQAAVLLVKLKYLDKWTKKRQLIASEYLSMINSKEELMLPEVQNYAEHVWHLFVIKSKQRDRLKKYLHNAGIQTVINYPTALPFLKAYARFSKKPEDYPCAYRNQNEILSIPLFPEMSSEQIYYVSDTLNNFL